MPQLLSQRRARHALTSIQGFANKHNEESKKSYLSAIKSVPMEIRANGLGQAIAMALSQSTRGENEDRRAAFGAIHEHFQSWLCNTDEPDTPFNGGALMQAMCDAEQAPYLIAQAEALAYAEWLKKFANAFLASVEETQAGDRQ